MFVKYRLSPESYLAMLEEWLTPEFDGFHQNYENHVDYAATDKRQKCNCPYWEGRWHTSRPSEQWYCCRQVVYKSVHGFTPISPVVRVGRNYCDGRHIPDSTYAEASTALHGGSDYCAELGQWGIASEWSVVVGEDGWATVTIDGPRHSLADWCPNILMDRADRLWRRFALDEYESMRDDVPPSAVGLSPDREASEPQLCYCEDCVGVTPLERHLETLERRLTMKG